MRMVEVTATVDDDDGDPLGTWSSSTQEARINYLRPNETWNFRIWFQNIDLQNAASYTVSADGQLVQNGGQGNFLFGGNNVNVDPSGQIVTPQGQVVGNATIQRNNQSQGQGFQNVRIMRGGRVINQQGQTVGQVQVDQTGGGNSSSSLL